MSGSGKVRAICRAIAVVVICASAIPALAQQPGSRQTRDFVTEAAQTDAFEMMEAASALAGSQDPEVIAFAQRMMRDHAMTTAALKQAVAQTRLEQPPMQMSSGQAAFLAALQSARGAAFDRLYWQQQVLGHRAALVVEQRYAADGDDPAIRQAAIQAIPIIEAHLAIAERMVATGR